ncbi:uncharacterized protein LOC113498907 isoform X3 [Trichoplusia ni]|uniref:Uncharacterized protein LOC113498907 isoform X3 n=1 Tax=Trichoplusia ni TaxID=7111 RepID=A0A7E5W2X6_TRINI|nr:uncharacterized protein LOC113498907 isoform X3 [Trichoplusia ni]
MAFFALLWKARTIEKYRINYEKEKINSIAMGNTQMEQTLTQRWRHYRTDTQKKISRTFRRWYPEGSGVSNFFYYLTTDQTFPNFLFKSVMGFVGGIILTYLCFMFFVFQLSISLIHATIMSSIIGVLLTLGLAFSYRIRCLVFLLMPQFFSRVGRYTLTCYALVLILTGPATNTLKNSEVLSESMACSQEHIKLSVHQLNDFIKKPYNSMRDSVKLMMDKFNAITLKVKEMLVKFDRLVLSLVSVIQSSFSWLQSVADICNAKLGTPYDRCTNVLQDGISDCKKTLGPEISIICNVAFVAQAACYSVKPFKAFCYATDFMDEAITASVKKKIKNFTEQLRSLFYVEVQIHQSYTYSSNTSRSASQVAAGIVTEIRNRADPLLTWLSWSSCVTSLFLLLIIFRAKYYQHMYETRSRFDNRYITKDLQDLDLKRQRQGRETVLPLNRRERAKYITTTSFRLVASEKVYLNRSAVFMAVTTFKLLIHMVADYSLYWVLMTIRYHGSYQSELMPGLPHSGVHVSGSGFVARLFRSIVGTLDIPLMAPVPSSIPCLPDPYPPDFRRYTQIGVLIFLLWFFALFEPYGLRLRHLIMGHYRPERAKARATWLYNHILRTRAGFMKFARRKLHKEYKYSSDASLTFRQWLSDHIPFQCVKCILGLGPKEPHCLLCGATGGYRDPDSELIRCHTPDCPGIYCLSCFADIGQLCTICLSPADYGDFSDVSLEKGSSDDSDSDSEGQAAYKVTEENVSLLGHHTSGRLTTQSGSNHRWRFFTRTGPLQQDNTLALLPHTQKEKDFFTSYFQTRLRKIRQNIRARNWDNKYTHDWVEKLSSENVYDFAADNIFLIGQNKLDDFEEKVIRTKSIGINTDKHRCTIVNYLFNRFSRRKLKRPAGRKQKKKEKLRKRLKLGPPNRSNKNNYNSENDFSMESRRIVQYNGMGPNRRFSAATRSLHTHNLSICQRNLKKVMRRKIDRKTNKRIKVFKQVNGMVTAIRNFIKGNGGIHFRKEIDSTEQNNTPVENKEEITKPTDNSNDKNENKSEKEISKPNKFKKPGKIKGPNALKPKTPRHKITDFQTFVTKQWNNIKYSMIPCTTPNTRATTPMMKEKRNHKRRKKRKCVVDYTETAVEECFAKKDIKHTRNLRISAFLAELEWTKKDFKKDKNDLNDSFFCNDGMAAMPAITTNKIVGMVQLKNLPFQWREAPHKYEMCKCKDKNCNCEKRLSILGNLSKQKMYAKKALERFRNKIDTVEESPPTSLVKKMISTLNADADRTIMNLDSSICLSKRASFYRTFTKELAESSDIIDTDTLFKNDHFEDDIPLNLLLSDDEDGDGDNKDKDQLHISTPKESLSHALMVVSHSSSKKDKPIVTKRCRCDLYEDLQRRWTNVRNLNFRTLSEKGPKMPIAASKFKTPFSLLRDFCSSLFGPSCTVDTCPNRKKRKEREKLEKARQKAIKKCRKRVQQTQTCIRAKARKEQTACQTCPQKDTQTQLSSGAELQRCIEIEAERARQIEREKRYEQEKKKGLTLKTVERKPKVDKIGKLPSDIVICDKERRKLMECEAKQRRLMEGPSCITQKEQDLMNIKGSDMSCKSRILGFLKPRPSSPKNNVGVLVGPETASGACQAEDCPNFCHRSMQYDKPSVPLVEQGKEPGSVKCLCDVTVGSVHTLCTCATQHISINRVSVGTKPSPTLTEEFLAAPQQPRPPCVNKKIQYSPKQPMAHKSTSYEEVVAKKPKDAIKPAVTIQQQQVQPRLSLESSMCLLDNKKFAEVILSECLPRSSPDVDASPINNVRKPNNHNLPGELTSFGNPSEAHGDATLTTCEPLPDLLTDTVTDTSISSISLTDETKTDTTICSLATVDDIPRRRKFRVKVVTKTNQATITDKTRLCDTGTITNDWWSPIVERRANDTILLEKKKGYNAIERQKRELKELKEWKELREVRKRRRNCGVTTDGRIVTFRSRTQIIPTGLFSGTNDILSPSRYLLESQKYYNELFSYNFRPPPQMEYSCVTQGSKHPEKEKIRSPVGSRRNHHHKTKRLEECYSPRRQSSPRKRHVMDPYRDTRMSESPRRRSNTHRHTRHSYDDDKSLYAARCVLRRLATQANFKMW